MCAVKRRWFSAGDRPVRQRVVPAGSNRNGSGSNEAVGAFDVEVAYCQPALAKGCISQRGICLFLALVMLLSPEGLVQLAQADVQYSQLCTNSWGKGGQMGKGDIVNYSNLLFPKYIVCAISPAWTFPFTQPLSRLRDILKQPPFFARSAANASVQRGI
ncbi:MAG: hypothetical protein GX602_01995 [Dehalococcoidales bacterium]|nr:hypothetical protein [Dehalococcoidales bacterium]